MRRSKLSLSTGSILITMCMLILVTSCRKNKATSEDTGFAADQATSEVTFNDVQTIGDQAADLTSGGTLSFRTASTTIGSCATVTRSTGKIVIDFGTTDFLCKDGRTRRGKIILTFTGEYADSGSVHSITFDNYYQNDNKITGTKTVTNMGHNAAGQLYFNVTVNGSVTKSGGGTVSTNWTRVRTWTQGSNTTDRSDDVYEITGSGTLTRANGNVITITIGNPLVVAANCRWIEAGTVTFVAGKETHVLDYGNTPNCDDMATVTLSNGTVKNITLP